MPAHLVITQGLGIGLKLTFSGNNQLSKGSFWLFVVLVAVSVVTQMNYLNKVRFFLISRGLVEMCPPLFLYFPYIWKYAHTTSL